MKQQITLEDLIAWKIETRISFARETGRDGRKTLYATLTGAYEVESNGEMIERTVNPERAVRIYNEL